ncbi:MAG: gliding motility-associated ABC transporter permease subunit GldF [Bernardetiaceae bacterium]|nr:gliding motility-associated ABC transporter permease subunit GldF [Bernardetiaceae bacterium]
MFEVLKKEWRSFLSSLIAYVVISVFLVIMGLFVWVFPQTNILDSGFADMYAFFSIAPYVLLFLIPAITMRMFAEEKRAGTMELLFTRPLRDWDIILGKYLASFLLVVFALLPTLLYYYSIYNLGNPSGNIDSAAVWGSYIGLLLLAAAFVAIGIFASSLTDNQIISFIVSVFLCFILYEGFTSLSRLDVWSEGAYFVSQLGIDFHYQSLSKGLIDLRNITYFLSLILVMLYSTKTVLASRHWA